MTIHEEGKETATIICGDLQTVALILLSSFFFQTSYLRDLCLQKIK